MSSEWRESANKRRDERHTKAEIERIPSRRKKNKQKWCKGKVGVLHTGVWQARKPFVTLGGDDLHKNQREFVCSKCRKILETWYGRKGIMGLGIGKRISRPRIGSTYPDGR
jgi:hypothetical protein